MKITIGTIIIEADSVTDIDLLIERLPKLASYTAEVQSVAKREKTPAVPLTGYSADQIALMNEALTQGRDYVASFLAITGKIRFRRTPEEEAKHGDDIESAAKERMEVATGTAIITENGADVPKVGEEIDLEE